MKKLILSAFTATSFLVGTLPSSGSDPGGYSGQVQYNNSGAFGGFTVSGDATLDTSTGGMTIGSGAITNSKMANMNNSTVKGNASGGTAAPTDLTTTQFTTLVNTFTSSLSGAAPASGGGTTNFLRADGSWASPSGSGTVNSGTAGQIGYYGSTGNAISGNANATVSSGALTLGQSGTAGSVVLNGSTSGTVTVGVPATAGTTTFTLPSTNGSSGQFLQTNGSGVTSWQTASGGGGGGFTLQTKSASFTAAAQYAYTVTATATVTLPDATAQTAGQEIFVINNGTGTLTFNTTSSQLISGQSSGAITSSVRYNTYRFITDASNWFLE